MYTIAHILDPQSERTWPEAVALVQELASRAGGLEVLPPAEGIVISDDGALDLGFPSETGLLPVMALARLLGALLEGIDAPEGLRRLTAENATDPPVHATVGEFSRALAFFERPGRATDLKALAGRLRAKASGSGYAPAFDPDREVERLREKVSGGVPEPEGAPVRAAVAEGRRALSRAAVLGISIAGAAALVAWGGFRLVDLLSPEPVVIDMTELEVEPLPVPGPTGVASAPAPSRPQTGIASIGEVRSYIPSFEAAASGVPDTMGQASTVVSAGLGPEPTSADRAVGRPGVGVDDSSQHAEGIIYSLADPRVQPPVLVRRVFPSRVDTDPDTGYFDLLVDRFGFVEEVRLVSPTNEFRERMLVSAAKAWQFRPARLDGRPVRFRTRIPITFAEAPR